MRKMGCFTLDLQFFTVFTTEWVGQAAKFVGRFRTIFSLKNHLVMKLKNQFLVICLVSVSTLFAQYTGDYLNLTPKLVLPDFVKKTPPSVKQDSEFEPNYAVKPTEFYENPILVNGKKLNYDQFTMVSTGELKIVSGNPESPKAQTIPFYVFIRRDGQVLQDQEMPFFNKQLYRVDLKTVFKFCKDGDDLILKPARVEDWQGKRILRLIDGC
jgi:hypothetical protein